MLEDPIQCGYLRTFCDSEHNAENLYFVLEVIKFRELFISEANIKECWDRLHTYVDSSTNERVNLSWVDLDEEYLESYLDAPVPADFNDTHPWPSPDLERKTVTDHIDIIWNKYFAKHSHEQLSLTEQTLTHTRKRLKMLNVYGGHVFGETVGECVFLLQRDVLPRFLNSTTCTDMVIRIDSLRVQPSANSIRVLPPSDSLLLYKTTDYFENVNKRFRLEEVLKDKILYGELLGYLRRTQASENLLCYRMIEAFEDVFGSLSTSKDLSKSWNYCVTHAWNVFKYFVAPGAPFEVFLKPDHAQRARAAVAGGGNTPHSHASATTVRYGTKQKKEIMLSLSKPHKNMFSDLKKAAYANLQASFGEYKLTEEYELLIELMRREKNKALSSTHMQWDSIYTWIFGTS